MNNTSKIIIAVVAVLAIGYAVLAFDIGRGGKITDFESCVAAGNPIMESYPRRCADDEGHVYVEDIEGEDMSDMIRISVPGRNALIGSPATFSGEARGMWFFEASFPIDIRANDGTVLGRGYAEAQGEWMTESFVPWIAIVSFDAKGNSEGVVRFMRDNPSGLLENDAHVDVPVKFKAGSTAAECRPTGCSGQICSDQDVASTCEFRPEYACYKTAQCQRLATGSCGWADTPALRACLMNPPQE